MSESLSDKVISRAVGEEMRRAREANGWSRDQLVARMPSGIGARTLLSYEHGTRHLTLLRFVEVCQALGASSPHVLGLGLQRARIYLEKLALWVDLRALVSDDTVEFRSMIMWAHNKLIEYPGGIVAVVPGAVRELATMIGSTHRDLATFLSRFTPDLDQIPDTDDDRIRTAI